MESKIPEWFLSFYESLFSAQLRAVRQLKSFKPKKATKRTKGREDKSMSNMDMAIDILRRSKIPFISLRLLPRSRPNTVSLWIGNPWSAPWSKRSIVVRAYPNGSQYLSDRDRGKVKRRPSSRNRERIESDELLRKLMELLWVYRGMIRLTILKNIALVPMP